jgi:Peptidase A4 family
MFRNSAAVTLAVAATLVLGVSQAQAKPMQYSSRNWSGYIAFPFNLQSSGATATPFNKVSASWVLPAPGVTTCDQPNSYAATWVGFDGWFNGNDEEAGTLINCQTNHPPAYTMMWEMTNGGIQIGPDVFPGDHITASVTYTAPNFILVVNDTTTGATMRIPEPCGQGLVCQRDSAEVIVEDPNEFGQPGAWSPFPNFGHINLSNASMHNSAGKTGTFTSSHWGDAAFTMRDGNAPSVVMATTSALKNKGAAFTVTWHHES